MVENADDDEGGTRYAGRDRFRADPDNDTETDQQMLQRKLRQMSEKQRSITGWSVFLGGVLVLVVGVWFNHYANFPEFVTVTFPTEEAATFVADDTVRFEREARVVSETPTIDPALPQATVDLTVEVDYFGWVPRGCLFEGSDWCFPWFTIGHLVAFLGSQMMLAGLTVAIVLGRKMTWSLASFAAFIAMFEMVLLFGTVGSEWLNLAQGPLNWTEQNDAFTISGLLVLQNDVGVSWSAIKDFVSINYNMAALTGVILFSLKIQDWGKPLPDEEPPEPQTSPYGRPLVKGAK